VGTLTIQSAELRTWNNSTVWVPNFPTNGPSWPVDGFADPTANAQPFPEWTAGNCFRGCWRLYPITVSISPTRETVPAGTTLPFTATVGQNNVGDDEDRIESHCVRERIGFLCFLKVAELFSWASQKQESLFDVRASLAFLIVIRKFKAQSQQTARAFVVRC